MNYTDSIDIGQESGPKYLFGSGPGPAPESNDVAEQPPNSLPEVWFHDIESGKLRQCHLIRDNPDDGNYRVIIDGKEQDVERGLVFSTRTNDIADAVSLDGRYRLVKDEDDNLQVKPLSGGPSDTDLSELH